MKFLNLVALFAAGICFDAAEGRHHRRDGSCHKKHYHTSSASVGTGYGGVQDSSYGKYSKSSSRNGVYALSQSVDGGYLDAGIFSTVSPYVYAANTRTRSAGSYSRVPTNREHSEQFSASSTGHTRHESSSTASRVESTLSSTIATSSGTGSSPYSVATSISTVSSKSDSSITSAATTSLASSSSSSSADSSSSSSEVSSLSTSETSSSGTSSTSSSEVTSIASSSSFIESSSSSVASSESSTFSTSSVEPTSSITSVTSASSTISSSTSSVSPSPSVVCPENPQRAVIQVFDSTGLVSLGYIRNTYDGQASYTYGTLANALQVQVNYNGASCNSVTGVTITALNGPDASHPLIGAVGGSGGYNFNSGSLGYAYFSGAGLTPPNAPPSFTAGHSLQALGYNGPAESSIWSYNPATNALTTQWTNVDGSQPATRIFYNAAVNFLGPVGDFALFVQTFPNEGAVLVNLRLVAL